MRDTQHPRNPRTLGNTPAEATSPLALTGTWFGRWGTRPYELLGLHPARVTPEPPARVRLAA